MADLIIPPGFKDITSIGKYENIHLILHENTSKIYVLKTLDLFNEEIYSHLFNLDDIHIPHLFSIEKIDDKLQIIEEYISGTTLEQLFEQNGVFSEPQTVQIIAQLCDVLSVLHSHMPPIIHRDIKLSNIMLTDENMVKLIDFNAARIPDINKSQDTQFVGTTGYAAPEQYGFGQSDARSDIYSLGVVMNRLLTGRFPQEQLYQGQLKSIIERCIRLDPDQRYQSAAELKDSLCPEGQRAGKPKNSPEHKKPKAWKIVLFIVLLPFMSSLAHAVAFHDAVRCASRSLEQIILFLWEFSLFCMYTNWGGISERLRIKRKSRVATIINYMIFTGLFLIIAAFLSVLLNSPPK